MYVCGGAIKIGARPFWGRGMFVLVISNINIGFQKSLTPPLTTHMFFGSDRSTMNWCNITPKTHTVIKSRHQQCPLQTYSTHCVNTFDVWCWLITCFCLSCCRFTDRLCLNMSLLIKLETPETKTGSEFDCKSQDIGSEFTGTYLRDKQ